MNIQQYLQRISYTGNLHPTLEVLTQLQAAHLMKVPFENLDIHNHIRIDFENLFDKIVLRNRGGFCYELNGLFYQLLKELNFNVWMVSARVYNGKNDFGPEFDHLALIVEIDKNNYLVDVGFGEFAIQPLPIIINQNTEDPRGIYRIETFNEEHLVVKKMSEGGEYLPVYIFSEKTRMLNEFSGMCNYHQTNSNSHFTQKRICSLPTTDGRVSLTDNKIKITKQGRIEEWELNNEEEVSRELWNYFGVKL